MQVIGVNKAKLSFVWDFRSQAVHQVQHASLAELSLGELLYKVLVSEDDVQMQQKEV